ncbi:MAG: DinB superfamily protein [Bryobacterales bacterium]|nr:DinB superfamily protein [Bryobacterales bacterium]
MSSFSRRLQAAVAEEEPRLRSISDQFSGDRPEDGERWSKKQELGHLIDSAVNNRVRFIRAALESQYCGPSYDGRGWVDLGGYAEMVWTDLIDLWATSNRSLAIVLDRIPPDRMTAECRIGNADAVTLEFLIDDYISHMQHHLDHIIAV